MLTANPWLSVYIKGETSKWKELEKAVHIVLKPCEIRVVALP